MNRNIRLKLSAFFGLLFLVFLFILFSYFVQTNLRFFQELVVNDFLGMSVYVFLHILAIVLMPLTVFPLISLAVGLWGWKMTFLLTLIGWEVGAILAFLISRKFGVFFLEKIMSLDKIHKFEDKVLKYGNGFWEIFFLRIIIPIDGLSYAIGLFSKVGVVSYSLATLFGIMPLLFVFCYFGSVSFIYQIMIAIIVLILFLGWLVFREIFANRR